MPSSRLPQPRIVCDWVVMVLPQHLWRSFFHPKCSVPWPWTREYCLVSYLNTAQFYLSKFHMWRPKNLHELHLLWYFWSASLASTWWNHYVFFAMVLPIVSLAFASGDATAVPLCLMDIFMWLSLCHQVEWPLSSLIFSITIGQPVPKYDVMGCTWGSDLSFASLVLFRIRGW